MKKIEALTPTQERAMFAYRDEWLAIGRSTSPADRPAAEVAITALYAALPEPQPQPRFWWVDGPAVGGLVRTLLTQKGKDWDNLGANLVANLRANLRDNLWANLRDNLRANLGDNLRDNLRANLRANLWANLRDNLGANLGDNLRDNLRDNLGDNLNWNFWGQHEAAWPAFYNWPNAVLRTMYPADKALLLSHWLSISQSCGWWQPFKGVVFICERPSVQVVNARGQLHKDGSPALLCRDGWPVYALNGIRMKPEHVLTPAEKLTPESVLAETNADVRRELIRKIGVERMLEKLPHKRLHSRGDYTLLSVDLPGIANDVRYLQMLNPSIGCWHLEAINKQECAEKTVDAALNWRNGQRFTDAEILT